MKNSLDILLIEDDETVCGAISSYISSISNINLTGITNNAEDAIELVKAKNPNAIILDLELHEGGGNGITFLQQIKKLQLERYPYILVTTNNCSPITHSIARQSGADFIITKYQQDFSAKSVVDFLCSISDIINNSPKSQGIPVEMVTNETEEKLNSRITKIIFDELNNVGISPKAIGKKYLTDSIQLIIKNPITHYIPIIAQKYKKSDASIERAMQNAINSAWRSSDIEDLLKYYTARIRSDKGVPTVSEFIFYYADKIKNDF